VASPVAPAATVEPATTVEAVTAAEALVPVESATIPSASAMPSAASIATATVEAAPSAIKPATIVAAAPPGAPTATIEAMKPRARSDEHATFKIIRPVIAVRCARIWRIVIVSVRTIGRWPNIAWANNKLNPHLSMGSTSGQEHKEPDRNHVL